MGGDPLELLEQWFVSQCDGEWERAHGVSIGTLANPGWTITINLEGTELHGRELDWVEHNTSEHDWLHYSVRDNSLTVRAGPATLSRPWWRSHVW